MDRSIRALQIWMRILGIGRNLEQELSLFGIEFYSQSRCRIQEQPPPIKVDIVFVEIGRPLNFTTRQLHQTANGTTGTKHMYQAGS